MSYAKTAELSDVPFGMLNRMDARNHVLVGIQIPRGKGQF